MPGSGRVRRGRPPWSRQLNGSIGAPPSLPADQVKRLERLARRYPRDVVAAPYSQLEDGIALTAWGRLLRLESYDVPAIRSFVEALRGRYQHGWQR